MRSSAQQTTLRAPAICAGVGLHSGQPVTMTLLPAEPGTGIVFRRTDIAASDPYIEARYDYVTATQLGTTLQNPSGVSVATVEHVMAALAGFAIDNVVVEVAGPEIPVMDGSCRPFLAILDRAGVTSSPPPRPVVRVLERIAVSDGDKRASLSPCDGFVIGFEIDFPVIGRQRAEIEISPRSFRREIAPARTFGFLKDVDAMRAQGLARGGSLDNAIVIGDDGIVNPEPLRFVDEFVRHKILDALGDLALAGAPLLARYEGVKAGHALNNQLLRALFADTTKWSVEPGAGLGAPARVAALAGAMA